MVEYSAFNRKVLGSIPRQPNNYKNTRIMGIEPMTSPRQGDVLPLNYTLIQPKIKYIREKGIRTLDMYCTYLKLAI